MKSIIVNQNKRETPLKNDNKDDCADLARCSRDLILALDKMFKDQEYISMFSAGQMAIGKTYAGKTVGYEVLQLRSVLKRFPLI